MNYEETDNAGAQLPSGVAAVSGPGRITCARGKMPILLSREKTVGNGWLVALMLPLTFVDKLTISVSQSQGTLKVFVPELTGTKVLFEGWSTLRMRRRPCEKLDHLPYYLRVDNLD